MLPRELFPDERSLGELRPAPRQSPEPRLERAVRRALDFSAALALSVIFAPALLWAAAAVKLSSPGPAFYRQSRVGRDGRIFQIWKFRTMFLSGPTGPLVTAQDDVRITPLGRHLRSWKLDEMPQLFNVLRGEMSLVGPRPQVPRFVDCFDPHLRRLTLSVRPGMTGPTALFFRHEEFLLAGTVDRERFYVKYLLPVKLQMDADYLQRRSLRYDLRILADTLHLVFSRLTGHAGSSGIPAAYDMAAIQSAEPAQLARSAGSPRTAISKTA